MIISNLIFHYKLNNNASNTTVTDGAGTLNGVATVNTNTLSSAGKINQAFNMQDQHVTLSTMYQHVDNEKLTICAWVYLDPADRTLPRMAILGRTYGSNSSYRPGGLHYLADTNGSFDFHVRLNGSNIQAISTTTVDTIGWYHVVGCWQRNDTIQIWVNGNMDTELATTDFACATSTSASFIGLRTGSGFGTFKGKIDDLRVYNKKLTPKEIAVLYNNGNGTEAQEFANNDNFFFSM